MNKHLLSDILAGLMIFSAVLAAVSSGLLIALDHQAQINQHQQIERSLKK